MFTVLCGGKLVGVGDFSIVPRFDGQFHFRGEVLDDEPGKTTNRHCSRDDFFSCSAAGSAHAIVIPVSWEYHLGYTIIMPRTRIIAAFLIYRTTIDSVFVTLEWVLVFLLTHIRGLVLPGSTHGTHSGSV
jgi:hypothetical protein